MGQEENAMPLGAQQYNNFTQFTMDVWNDKMFYQAKEFPAGFMATSILNIPDEKLPELLKATGALSFLFPELMQSSDEEAARVFPQLREQIIHLTELLWKYPPFCDIIMIGISGKDESLVIKKAQEIHAYLKYRVINEKFGLLLYSPVSSPINRIQGRFRWRIIIKCLYDDRVNNLILDAFKECTSGKDETRVIADVNPTNMM